MIGRRLGHYRIETEIGAGGMGVVYRAWDEHLERSVAVKVLPAGTLTDESARRRFRKEALALSRLNHTNIEIVHDFDTQEGVDFLVLEYVDGESLDAKLRRGPLTEKDLLRLGIQLGRGLIEAHGRGVIHRDLKPANLRVTPGGTLKILDFGLAALRATGGEAGLATLTSAGLGSPVVPTATMESTAQEEGWGTLPYMPPEQLRNEPTDARSDLYAVGAVLYEMATGRRAFPESQVPLLVDAILHQEPAPPRALRPQLSPALEAVIQKALEKDPERRYQTAKDLCVDLERAASPASIRSATAMRPSQSFQQPATDAATTLPNSRSNALPTSLRRWRYGVAGMVTAAAALTVWGVQSRWTNDRTPDGPARIASLAVLPLANLSGDPGQEYFADGMTEELITNLAKISGLRVISRSSSMQYKNQSKPTRDIGRELGVDALVEGSVRRSGDRVRITAQLVDVARDQHVWAEDYERNERDVLAMQGEVARAIADRIKVKLTPDEQVRLAASRAVDPEAHEAYLKARYSWNIFSRTEALKALDYFRQAVALDSTYAAAYAGLAEAYYGVSNLWMAPAEAMAKAREAASRALELDDTLADAHTSLAIIKSQYDWDFAGGEREYERAIALDPNNAPAHHWYGNFLIQHGRFQEAARLLQRAQELDPQSKFIRWHAAWIPFYERRYGDAIERLHGLVEIDSNYANAYSLLGETLEQTARWDEALQLLQKAFALEPTPWTLAAIGRVQARAGDAAAARRTLVQLQKMARQDYVSPYGPAGIYACLGDAESAFELLHEAFEERCEDLALLLVDPRMDVLREDPRYWMLLQRIGFRSATVPSAAPASSSSDS